MRQHRRNPPGHHRAIVVEKLRLPAAERRDALLETAARIFSERSYRRATTAEIAAEAGVSEPILYRHFPSKADLFMACIERGWGEMQARWAEALAAEPDPRTWVALTERIRTEEKKRRPQLAGLLAQAIVDAAEDPAIETFMRMHVRRVHEYVAGVYAEAQKAGGMPPDRDVDAEAWVFVGISLASMMAGRLGAMTDEDRKKIAVQRERWLTGA